MRARAPAFPALAGLLHSKIHFLGKASSRHKSRQVRIKNHPLARGPHESQSIGSNFDKALFLCGRTFWHGSSFFRGDRAWSPLINRHVRNISRPDVFGARANEFVVRVLFEDVRRPTADTTDGKNRGVEVERNSHHVVCRS